MPNLKTNFMIFWKEFFIQKGKASLLPILLAPSGRLIGCPWGTHTSPVESLVSLLTFLSTTFTFALETLFSGRLLVYPWAPKGHLCWLISSFIPLSTIWWSKQWNRTLPKPSSSATPFGTSTIYSVLTIWTLKITSAQFTLWNCNLWPLPHHLLKCVISTPVSRWAVQTHLSISASTIRGMTLHSGLSTFLTWTATFPPIQLTVRYARICSSKVDFLNRLRGLSLPLWQQGFVTNLPHKSFNKFFNPHGLIVVKYGATLREMRLAIQAWKTPSYPYITYLLLIVFYSLYLSTYACAFLFCAHALFIHLIDMCI